MKTRHDVKTLDYKKFNGNSLLHILSKAHEAVFVFQAGRKKWALREGAYLRTETMGTVEEIEELILKRLQNGSEIIWHCPKILMKMPRVAERIIARDVASELEL